MGEANPTIVIKSNARHPRACPGDLPTISYGVCGGCRSLQCPIPHEVLATPTHVIPGLVPGTSWWVRTVLVEGAMPFSAPS